MPPPIAPSCAAGPSGHDPAALAQRARILLAADGLANQHIADLVGVSKPTVLAWRSRYQQHGVAGLHDRPCADRAQTVRRQRRAEILAATLTPPSAELN